MIDHIFGNQGALFGDGGGDDDDNDDDNNGDSDAITTDTLIRIENNCNH